MDPSYPILEHNYDGEAKIEPSKLNAPQDVPEHCVVSFFQEVNRKIVSEQDAKIAVANRWEDGPHPIYEIEYNNERLAFFHPGVGGPVAAGLLEEAIAFGCKKFVVCGGCGVLENLPLGKLMVVESAVRDEGVSYHYIKPRREIRTNPNTLSAIQAVLEEHHHPYINVKTWTTDAPYRETQATIDARRAEGCLTVEMEAASLMAVAQFRGVLLGLILYAGDNLSGEAWDGRRWQSRKEVRENLFWLTAEACLKL